MGSTSGRVPARDGTSRLVRHWEANGEPWVHVLLLHGLGEHSGRYEHVGQWLARSGIDVHAFDHCGHGGSDGPRGDIDRWEHFHEDVEDRLAAVRALAGERAIALYGHSMGGLIALGYALSGRPLPELLVLSSPGLAASFPRWQRTLVTLFGRVVPGFRIPNGVDGAVLSRDPAVGAAYLADELNVHRSALRLGRLGFAEQDRVQAQLGALSIPTYVFHGADDPLVPAAASEPLGRLLGVTRVVLPGLRHETHNEPEGERVIAGAVDWLRAQAGDHRGAARG